MAILVSERKAARCDSGLCYKDCILGAKNEYGDFDLGWCYTKDSNGNPSKCSSDANCKDSFKCRMKCTIA